MGRSLPGGGGPLPENATSASLTQFATIRATALRIAVISSGRRQNPAALLFLVHMTQSHFTDTYPPAGGGGHS